MKGIEREIEEEEGGGGGEEGGGEEENRKKIQTEIIRFSLNFL